ncbi:hypothetical protein A2U01_0072413 [Trifolium medium]|uniref:Secreted protein n=1 Tax=Trifolium medium TaxID=97028 RepID=A0A392SR52_9FABA|nr:hypothetical protein [Trifolium medium]
MIVFVSIDLTLIGLFHFGDVGGGTRGNNGVFAVVTDLMSCGVVRWMRASPRTFPASLLFSLAITGDGELCRIEKGGG